MNEPANQNRSEDSADFKALLDLATPDLYSRNAFRLLEVHVEATDRDLSKRKQVMEVAARNKLPVPSGPCRVFPRTPAPDDHEIRECAHAIQDAERRLAHEFFWFWPLAVGQGGNDPCLRQLHQGDSDGPANTWSNCEKSQDEGPAAKHNLAILHHFSALEIERTFLNGKSPDGTSTQPKDQETSSTQEAERNWNAAIKYWKMVAVEQSCWSRVVARIRAVDDKSLTTGAARRMEKRLPVALALITTRLAIRFQQVGKPHHAQRQVTRLRASGFAAEAVDEALRIAVEPTRATIKTLCEAAKKDAEADPAKADSIVERVLDQTAEPLALLDLLLPDNNPARIAEHDQIALTALACSIDFGNKTANYKRSLELYDKLSPLASSTVAKERISHNRNILHGNLESALCWFCGVNQRDDSCMVEVEMHGDVVRTPTYNGQHITWRHTKVKVPRCPACKAHATKTETHQNVTGGGCFALAVASIAVGIWQGNVWTAGIGFIAFLIGAINTVALGLIYGLGFKPGEGIKLRPRDEYSGIKQLQSEGWAFGSQPV